MLLDEVGNGNDKLRGLNSQLKVHINDQKAPVSTLISCSCMAGMENRTQNLILQGAELHCTLTSQPHGAPAVKVRLVGMGL